MAKVTMTAETIESILTEMGVGYEDRTRYSEGYRLIDHPELLGCIYYDEQDPDNAGWACSYREDVGLSSEYGQSGPIETVSDIRQFVRDVRAEAERQAARP